MLSTLSSIKSDSEKMDTANFESAYISAASTVGTLSSSGENLISQTFTYLGVANEYQVALEVTYYSYFSLALLAMASALIGIFLILFQKSLNFKWFIHVGWFTSGLLTFLGFTGGIFLVVLGGTMQDSCNLLSQSVTQNGIDVYEKLIPNNL